MWFWQQILKFECPKMRRFLRLNPILSWKLSNACAFLTVQMLWSAPKINHFDKSATLIWIPSPQHPKNHKMRALNNFMHITIKIRQQVDLSIDSTVCYLETSFHSLKMCQSTNFFSILHKGYQLSVPHKFWFNFVNKELQELLYLQIAILIRNFDQPFDAQYNFQPFALQPTPSYHLTSTIL